MGRRACLRATIQLALAIKRGTSWPLQAQVCALCTAVEKDYYVSRNRSCNASHQAILSHLSDCQKSASVASQDYGLRVTTQMIQRRRLWYNDDIFALDTGKE